MLESIKNAVSKYINMGVLEKIEVKSRKERLALIGISPNFKEN